MYQLAWLVINQMQEAGLLPRSWQVVALVKPAFKWRRPNFSNMPHANMHLIVPVVRV